MQKPVEKENQRTFLDFEQLEAWKNGDPPAEIVDTSNFISQAPVPVSAYMLAHRHFLKSVGDILQNPNVSLENMYDMMLDLYTEQSRTSAAWWFSLKNSLDL